MISTWLLSGDTPRSRVLAVVLVLIFLGLALAPFIFPGTRSLNVAAKVAVFILLVASYDLLLGYTGIVSFAHTMFFGIGGYGVGIAMAKMGATWGSLLLGIAAVPARHAGPCVRDRPALAARARDLLRHDHARGGVVLPDPRLAALRLHRRRGRHQLPPAGAAATRGWSAYLRGVRGRAGAVSAAAARGQFAVRPRAALDPRERVQVGSARLPHRRVSHGGQLPGGAARHGGGRRCTRSGCAIPGRTPRSRSTS